MEWKLTCCGYVLSIFHFVFLVTTTCYDDLKVADMEEITEMMNLLS
jgi:hypothetical protein